MNGQLKPEASCHRAEVLDLIGNDTMPRVRRPLRLQYRPHLRALMSHKDGVDYGADAEFTRAQILEIRPRHIVRWMCRGAYGTEEPTDNDRPVNRRSSGLQFQKKAVSYFMPNRNAKWNVETETGNPTMSVAVNDLIKVVKKSEVRKQGKKSNAKRDMKRSEFRMSLRLLERYVRSFHQRHKVPCMKKLQFHIIGRADDISNICTEDVREHEVFKDFAAQTAVAWSKNVLEE